VTAARRAPVAIGVDIGGTKVLGVALDDDGAVVAETRVATPAQASAAAGHAPGAAGEVADAVATVVEALRRETGADGPSVPVGVGVPGMLDRRGVLVFSPHLPGAAGADVRALVGSRLSTTALLVENDANSAALAELRRGAAAGAEHAVMVTLGTGIGGGLISDGRVVAGAHGFAGEVGHMVVDPSGPPCPCGGRGCWERFASGSGLGHLARQAAESGRLHDVVITAGGTPEEVRGEHVTAAALEGDPEAVAVIEELGWWVAVGLANLTAVLDVERIVVGGGLAEVGDVLLRPTRRAFAELVEGARARPNVEIVPATCGERAGAMGAAMAARQGGLW
jgi:glucokinase